MKSSGSPTVPPDAVLRHDMVAYQAEAAGFGMLEGHAPQARAAAPASATTSMYQRRRAHPARHWGEHASQRTCVKSRALTASRQVGAASAPPCPSVTSGYKAHTLVTTGQERAKRYYAQMGSERPQLGQKAPSLVATPQHALPQLECLACGAEGIRTAGHARTPQRSLLNGSPPGRTRRSA